MGPGWCLAGDTATTGTPVLGSIGINTLWAAGYNVLTWDPRGFGQSGGVAEVDSPAYEARDVSSLIDWVATRPGVELDAPGDPRMGMVGGSYGGGIQLVTAATDCRVDAIVPTIAWHSLVTSLGKADTFKSGWSNILANLSGSDHVDPQVHEGQVSGNLTGTVTEAEQQWFAARGPGALVARIHIPTLFVQGTVDTLFTLQEGVENYEILKEDHVPTAMLWFCGGHGVCLTPPGNQELPVTATIDWLNRYVKRDTSVNTGPGFRFLDQNGTGYSTSGWPVAPGAPVTADGQGTLALVRRRWIRAGRHLGQLTAAGQPGRTDHAGQGGQRGERRHLLRQPVGRGGGRPPAAADLPGHDAPGAPAGTGLRPVGRRVDRPRPREPDHPHRRHPRRPVPHHLGPAGDGGVHRQTR